MSYNLPTLQSQTKTASNMNVKRYIVIVSSSLYMHEQLDIASYLMENIYLAHLITY